MQRQAVTDLGAASSGRMETGPIPDSGLSIVCLAPHTSTEDLPGSLLCFGLTLTINTRYSPAWAGSWPEPPPERSATRPLRLSRSERRATRCPCRSCRLGLQATNPARASSAHNSTEFTSFLEVRARSSSECGQQGPSSCPATLLRHISPGISCQGKGITEVTEGF